MSIFEDIEVNNVKQYAELLKQRYRLNETLSTINDKLVNLSVCMTNEDINKANTLFNDLMEHDL